VAKAEETFDGCGFLKDARLFASVEGTAKQAAEAVGKLGELGDGG
jgi:hypothetical protein